MDQGFSFASLILSYFLIAGGLFGGTLLAFQLRLDDQWAMLGALAAGSFVGGFIAARASRGSTIVEPALGAVLVIASIAGLAYTTPFGKLLWAAAQEPTMKLIGSIAGAGLVGAILGAAISEKLFGESTRSAIPWLLYTALTTFGSSLLIALLAQLLFASERGSHLDNTSVILIGLGAGCLLAGLAVGASARTRPLFSAFLGGGLGVAGLFALINYVEKMDRDTLLGSAILAGAGAVVTLLGTALGWAAFGRRRAG